MLIKWAHRYVSIVTPEAIGYTHHTIALKYHLKLFDVVTHILFHLQATYIATPIWRHIKVTNFKLKYVSHLR